MRRLILIVSLFLSFLLLVPSGAIAQDVGETAGGVDTSSFKYRGVNIRDLQTYPASKIEKTFSYLPSCSINTVRTMAVKNRGGVDALAPAAALAQQYGIQLVVALDDYAEGTSTLPTSTVHADPKAWFNGGYIDTGHYQYVLESASKLAAMPAVSVIELANEPHCGRIPGCLDPFTAWVVADVAALAGTGKTISIGTGMLGAVDTPGEGFETINSVEGIGQASTHWYPEDMPGREENLAEAANIAKSLGEEILLGEVGFNCVGGDNCMSSVNDEQRAGWLAKMFQMIGGWGYDGLLYWTFGGFRDGFDYYSENDGHSWFPANPGATEDPICEAFRGEVPPREFDFGSTSGAPSEDQTDETPLFVFPHTEDTNEWQKYLANSQVYCAPAQINWPELEGTDPTLSNCTVEGDIDPLGGGAGNPTDGACDPQEYPVVDYTERYDLKSASIPLWRDQDDLISIEIDLSRVNPQESFIEAVGKASRPQYAPQFYLTTPQQQCLNAANYINYVDQLCDTYPVLDENGVAKPCSAKDDITLPDGQKISWDVAARNLSADLCSDPQADITGDGITAKLIRSIAPRTPKVFKMGFLVQYNYTYGTNKDSLAGQYLFKKLASWFRNDDGEPILNQGERVTMVPVWYQSGISTSEYSPNQIAAYPIDPTFSANQQVQQVLENFSGPWWRTYAAALPMNIQKTIAQEKLNIVKGTYDTQRFIGGDKNLTYQGEALNFSVAEQSVLPYRGENYQSDGLIPCAGDTCLNKELEYYENLQASFPNSFQPAINSSFYEKLQKLVIQRVNAGRQKTAAYPQNVNGDGSQNGVWGPLSERNFERCPIDQENFRQGESETAEAVNYNLIQSLREGNWQGAGQAITNVINEFTGKVVWDKTQQDYEQLHQSYSFLVLPDESIDIDVTQSYVASMFLSPEMYGSIMSGENPIYPWKEKYEGEDESKIPDFMSAFLKTSGYDRDHFAPEEGYGKYQRKVTSYQQACSVINDPDLGPTQQNCRCTGEVISQDTDEAQWLTYPQQQEEQEPQPSNGCRKVEWQLLEKSTVSVTGNQAGENPNSNIQSPGQSAALNEFLRRMAFTPHYLIGEYPGLEDFYGGNTTSLYERTIKQLDLSDYFNKLYDMSDTFGNAQSENTCGAVYAEEIDVRRYAKQLTEIFSIPGFNEAAKAYYGDNAQLFGGECAPGEECFDFIINNILENPVCNGDRYINPYVAIGIAMNETGALNGRGDDNLGFHFGCTPIAWSEYNYTGEHQGQQCVVENASGYKVINPLIVWDDDAANSCIPNSAQTRWSEVRQNQTPADGFACMMTTFHRYCQSTAGSNIDFTALGPGLYNYSVPEAPLGRIVYIDYLEGSGDLMRIARDAARSSGRLDEVEPLLQEVETTVKGLISGCR